jgi:hypothetical protein
MQKYLASRAEAHERAGSHACNRNTHIHANTYLRIRITRWNMHIPEVYIAHIAGLGPHYKHQKHEFRDFYCYVVHNNSWFLNRKNAHLIVSLESIQPASSAGWMEQGQQKTKKHPGSLTLS